MLFFPNDPPDLTPPSTSVWARIKAMVLRATPATPDPTGDKHVAAWVQQHARNNDVAMPAPAPTGMRITPEALAACSVPTPQQSADIARHLEARSPRTGNTAALLPHTPQGPGI